MTKVIVIIDGLSDSLIAEGTPLEVSNIPNMREIASMGSVGRVMVMPFPVEPDVAFLSLMGNNPFKYYTGRGPIEAIGMHTNFSDGDLAMRCEFVKLKDDELVGPFTTIKIDDAKRIEETINRYLTVKGVSISSALDMYGGVIVFKSNRKLSNRISNSNPFYKIEFINMRWERNGSNWFVPISYYTIPPVKKVLKSIPKENSQAAIFSSNVVNTFVERTKTILKNNPVNLRERKVDAILLRDGGIKIPKLKSFNSNVGAVVDRAFERGIIHLMNGRIIPTPGRSNDFKRDYKIRALLTISSIYKYDTVIVSLKGPEYYSMMMNREEKIKVIEDLDRYFFGTLLNEFHLGRDTIAILSLRTFSSRFGIPTTDPVPIAIAGPEFGPDGIITFDESSAKYGKIGTINSIMLNQLLKF